MKNLTKDQKFQRKMMLVLYGINGLINLRAGLNVDGSVYIADINYND